MDDQWRCLLLPSLWCESNVFCIYSFYFRNPRFLRQHYCTRNARMPSMCPIEQSRVDSDVWVSWNGLPIPMNSVQSAIELRQSTITTMIEDLLHLIMWTPLTFVTTNKEKEIKKDFKINGSQATFRWSCSIRRLLFISYSVRKCPKKTKNRQVFLPF